MLGISDRGEAGQPDGDRWGEESGGQPDGDRWGRGDNQTVIDGGRRDKIIKRQFP